MSFSKKLEAYFLYLFLFSRLWIFIAHYGDAVGWDMQAHINRLAYWPWDYEAWDIRFYFYGFHPPVAFLLPKFLYFIGLDVTVSIQIVSALASLIGFFCIRASLAYLGLLYSWAGLFFLYFTSSLPIQIYLARSINIDVIVYAQACAVLYLSLLLFYNRNTRILSRNAQFKYGGVLLLCLIMAIMTKYSGLLLLTIPVLVVLVAPTQSGHVMSRGRFINLLIAACIGLGAVAIAFPYYHERYYKQTEQFFPTNMDLERYNKRFVAAKERQEDWEFLSFTRNLLASSSRNAPLMQDRDQNTVRLFNSWRDLWSGSKHNVEQSEASLRLSILYADIAFWLIWAGIIYFYMDICNKSDWHRLGIVLILFGFMQLLALVAYTYRYPHPLGIPNKGIYIAPALLGFGYIICNMAAFIGNIRAPKGLVGLVVCYISCAALIAFILCNALMPVY